MAKKPKFKYDAFISYSHRNKNWVRGVLLPRLENAGLKVFIDFRDFKIGAASVKEMARGITQSHKTLVVLTPDYLRSSWAEFEILMAQTLSPANKDLRVIPILRQECKLPASISYLHYVNLTKGKEAEWEKLIDALSGNKLAQNLLTSIQSNARDIKQSVKKILVVDDTQDVKVTIGGLLEDLGYEVYMAEDEDGAFRIFKETSIDFAVIDIRLHDAPGDESGLKLAHAIYSLAPHIQTIILSGSTRPRHYQSAASYGVIDYIVKTDGWEDILIKVINKISEGNDKEKSTTDTPRKNSVFISYSHKNRRWLEKFKTNLKVLERTNNLNIWDDTKIKSGTKWRGEIEDALASAKIALLLVTPEFLASDFITNNELPYIFKAAENSGLQILWIAVEPSMYEDTYICEFQAANNPSRPLSSLSKAKADQEVIKICKKVKEAAAG